MPTCRLLPALLTLFLALTAAAAPVEHRPLATDQGQRTPPAADGTLSATRFVAPAGNDAANPCLDPAAPCRTIAHALEQAEADDTVRIAPGTYGEAHLMVTRPVRLAGDNASVIDGGGNGPILTVRPGGEATLDGLTLRNGGGARGGAVLVEPGGALHLQHAGLRNNAATLGGAIYAAGGSVTIADSVFSGNVADGGGAIFLAAGSLTLAATELTENHAALGGALFVGSAATAALDRAILRGNEAARLGGAGYNAGTLRAANSLWQDSRAGIRGGGLYNEGGSAVLEFTTWLGNVAAAGGAVAGSGDLRLRHSVLAGSGGGDCAATLSGEGNRLDDTTCGLVATAATNLGPDGRPGSGSNVIDTAAPGACVLEASGVLPPADLRGEPRPADGDGDGRALCDAGAYEFQPRLAIVHSPSLADATRFEFGGDLGEFALTEGAPRQFFELAPGSYRVAQAREQGWKLATLACAGDSDGGSAVDLASRAVTVDLDPGETIACVFTSRAARETLGLAIESSGAAAVGVAGDLGTFALSLPDDPDWRTGRLAPGVYTVQLQAPPGWRAETMHCTGDRDLGSSFDPITALARLDLDARETIGCAFRIAPLPLSATLIVRHETAPSEDTAFAYVGDVGPFTLRASSQPETSFALTPGTYRVHELLHPLWELIALGCAGDLDGSTSLHPEEATAIVDLDPGERVTCIFRHARTAAGAGAITIAQHAPEPIAFAFDGALGGFALSVPGEPSRTWAELRPGRYAVRQMTAAGWTLAELACDGDMDGGSELSRDLGTATIDLDAGETISCTFSNVRATTNGRVTVVHEPDPADNTAFRYTGTLEGFSLRSPTRPSRTFDGLAPGTYRLAVRLIDGWRLESLSCEGDTDGGSAVDLGAASVVIDLDAVEAITCRFRPVRDAGPPLSGAAVYLPFQTR